VKVNYGRIGLARVLVENASTQVGGFACHSGCGITDIILNLIHVKVKKRWKLFAHSAHPRGQAAAFTRSFT
jgi:hypothetical protein